MKKVIAVILLFSQAALAGYPPTTSKGSADSSDTVTFKYQFPNFTGTHTGATFSLGVNSVAGGGTGLSTLTANGVLIGNGTSAPTFVSPGGSGNVLQSNGTTWVSAAAPASTPTYIPVTLQKFISGSGTYFPSFVFIVSSANATVGATYTNNSITFTVTNTISAGTQLVMTAPTMSVPTSSGTLTKASGVGDATITFSAYKLPMYDHIRMVGGGGGGGGSSAGANGGGGTTGGNTTFGTSLLTANGGQGGGTAGQANSGGSATIATGIFGFALTGAMGQGGAYNNGAALANGGTLGASSPFGGAGSGNRGGTAGAAVANSGSGGGGGATTGNATDYQGGPGAAGGYIDAFIPYSYLLSNYGTGVPVSIGTGGSGGAAGTSGNAGGAGGAGVVLVEEHYQ